MGLKRGVVVVAATALMLAGCAYSDDIRMRDPRTGQVTSCHGYHIISGTAGDSVSVSRTTSEPGGSGRREGSDDKGSPRRPTK